MGRIAFLLLALFAEMEVTFTVERFCTCGRRQRRWPRIDPGISLLLTHNIHAYDRSPDAWRFRVIWYVARVFGVL